MALLSLSSFRRVAAVAGVTFLLAILKPSRAADRPANLPVTTEEVGSLYGATTINGQRLSFDQLKPLILAAGMPPSIYAASANWRLKVGVFLLSVRPEGTVSKVEMLQSTGYLPLDRHVTSYLMRWRFRPNSVKEVRVPAYYVHRHRS